MFFVVRSNGSFNFLLGLIKYNCYKDDDDDDDDDDDNRRQTAPVTRAGLVSCPVCCLSQKGLLMAAITPLKTAGLLSALQLCPFKASAASPESLRASAVVPPAVRHVTSG